MNRQDFDSLEIEANAAPHIGTHHIHFPRGYDSKKLLKIVKQEALDQLERGQNLGAYPYGYESACGYIPSHEK